jgi:hemolysin activation/secretion protein
MYKQGISTDLTAAYSNSTTQNGTLFFAGKGYVLGGRLNFPLSDWGDARQKLVVGADYKLSKNSFTACTGTCGTITEIPFSAMYYSQVARPTFQGNGSITLVANKFGSSEADYQQASPNVGGSIQAKPTWHAWRMNGSAGFMLPHDWQTRFSGNAQYSSDLLIPAEQFGAGGANSVRGYPEHFIAGNKGLNNNLEFYTPDFGVKYLTSLRALIFWDQGKVYNLVVGMPSSTGIASYGLGLRMTGKNASLKLDVGRALKEYSNGASVVKKGAVRADFSLSVIF